MAYMLPIHEIIFRSVPKMLASRNPKLASGAFIAFWGLVLLPSCWNWSFPERLLNEDSGARDPDSADSGGAGGGDQLGGQAGSIVPGNGGTGGLGGGGMAGQSCPAGCSDRLRPACGSDGVCRPCAAHNECPAGLCALDGTCPAESSIAFVNANCASGTVEDGSRTKPFCGLLAAQNDARPFLMLAAGTHRPATITNDHQIYGSPGARVSGSGCEAIAVKDAAEVVMVGLTFQSGVQVDGQGARLTLIGNTVGPSDCVGIEAKGSSQLVAGRNYITSNAKGGIFVDAAGSDIVNNIIAGNGSAETAWGGVWLKPAGGQNFVNNTVVDNRAKASNKEEVGGVYCAGAANLLNTILWANTFGKASPPPGQQWAGACTIRSSLIQVQSGGGVDPGNLSDDPLFVGQPAGTPAAYHLTRSSPAVDKGSPIGAPNVDYDAEARSDGKPDIGADEI